MNILEIITLGIALAVDALLVSFTYGLILREKRFQNCIKLATSFCFFQALMPIIGYFITGFVTNLISSYSKWIVFVIFSALAIKFVKDAFEKEERNNIICISFSCLMYLSIATSIDALAAGVSINLTKTNIWLASGIIGLTTFVLSTTSFQITSIFKKIPKRLITIIGAMLLFGLAIKNIL